MTLRTYGRGLQTEFWSVTIRLPGRTRRCPTSVKAFRIYKPIEDPKAQTSTWSQNSDTSSTAAHVEQQHTSGTTLIPVAVQAFYRCNIQDSATIPCKSVPHASNGHCRALGDVIWRKPRNFQANYHMKDVKRPSPRFLRCLGLLLFYAARPLYDLGPVRPAKPEASTKGQNMVVSNNRGTPI